MANASANSKVKARSKFHGAVSKISGFSFLIFFVGVGLNFITMGLGLAAVVAGFCALFIFLSCTLIVWLIYLVPSYKIVSSPKSVATEKTVTTNNAKTVNKSDYDWTADSAAAQHWRLLENYFFIDDTGRYSEVFYDISSMFISNQAVWFQLKIEFDDDNYDLMICIHEESWPDLLVPSRCEHRIIDGKISKHIRGRGAVDGLKFTNFKEMVGGIRNMAGSANFNYPPRYVTETLKILAKNSL